MHRNDKLAKARKMHKPPGTLGLKKFGPGKFWVKKVWAQHIEKVDEKLKRKLKKKKNLENLGKTEEVEEKLRKLRKN